MAEQWTNNKGVKFVGQTSSVPAPDFKAATSVDYNELHSVEIVLVGGSTPTQAGNASAQAFNLTASIKSSASDPLASWENPISFSSGNGDFEIGIQNVISTPPSGSAQVVFPAGIKAGQKGVIQAASGAARGILKVTVL